ncbi:tRNA nucleotidyltransferase/poly(A) polymerase family protein [Bordetella bronchiseptica MBORD678]|uniref:CCA tRNA nucleotidyltransferase n=2 Tax=Bordetella bronchiseptica TaxID=518 RepID=UPI0004610460|nr:CCA tRNA nucleotidyltransferase [Bordetella bronchiseptica]KDB67048.1 tRNA nucleotidyltransferase/poly(A) polymerase family protein [Bordetella bronchiseptica A1-7]KDB72799.1 tRNA nucleotidyltransferase/poly(A) polymerase family protein [Bordetella bronchiseptica B20-10725633]KDD04775.1 tRNA nucleotidyltransferase/poly(A) polymerase family protein [Bordetella bronchiseptica MBORD681]KDD05635.1 tRNA nucleotidyltransferase/poly(A) polymerase family protein [Bordetella bronchiseptica MBORD698]
MSRTDDPGVAGLQVYIVGGAVRDGLLGLPAGDRDWVVVGATPEDMARRGFIPVGGDFPVFLHPRTKEEYALARTERKSGRGYKGFTFYTGADVTLEQDLQRRDLTVNAIARTPQGELVDPLDGVADVRARVLRHVGEAFAEDPVRILRLGRFAARFGDFSIAPETMQLCRRMVEAGEADALVPERVWKEVSRGLMAQAPSRMLDVLARAGALARVMPELHDDAAVRAEIDRAAAAGLPLAGRYALLCRHTPERDALGRRLRAPVECMDQARLLPLAVDALAASATPAAQLDLIERCDALRKPERFDALLQAAAIVAPVDLSAWRARVQAVRAIDAGAIARQCAGDPAHIKPALRQARLQALGGA